MSWALIYYVIAAQVQAKPAYSEKRLVNVLSWLTDRDVWNVKNTAEIYI